MIRKLLIALMFAQLTLIQLAFSEETESSTDPIQAGPTNFKDSVPDTQSDTTQIVQEGGFTFKANSIDLHTALALFAQSAGLTLRSEVPLEGNRDVDFKNQTLNSAIEQIISPDSIPWVIQSNSLIVGTRPEPTIRSAFKGIEVEGDNNYRIITIDYPQTLRTSRNAAEGAVNGLNGRAAEVSIISEENNDFWGEVKTTIEALISSEGKYSINYMTGVIYLQDHTNELNSIQNYLMKVVPILTRQVRITARIYEVELTDENSLGLDWSFIGQRNFNNLDAGSSVQTGTIQREGYKPAAISTNLGFVDNFSFILEGLSHQGNLNSISQPRIVTVHNQPAIVKVGTLYPYFNTLVQVDPNTGARVVTENIELISLGTWLSITPQIAKDSSITLTIDPVLTNLQGSITSSQGATAPIVDIKQSSSILRVRNRETVRISGLQQTKDQEIHRKVPFLGDIPLVGSLFSWSNIKKTRSELVIFITTEVVD